MKAIDLIKKAIEGRPADHPQALAAIDARAVFEVADAEVKKAEKANKPPDKIVLRLRDGSARALIGKPEEAADERFEVFQKVRDLYRLLEVAGVKVEPVRESP